MTPLTPPTADQVYVNSLSCVSFIANRIEMIGSNQTEEQRRDDIRRNVEHLEIIVARDIWTTQDLTPFFSAIEAGRAYLENRPTPPIAQPEAPTLLQRLRATETLINLILDEEGE